MPHPVGGDECSGSRFDSQFRQGGIVLLSIFAETGKSRLSVKPRPVGGEFHSEGNWVEEESFVLIMCEETAHRHSFLSKYARIPPSSAGAMNGLPSPLGGEG